MGIEIKLNIGKECKIKSTSHFLKKELRRSPSNRVHVPQAGIQAGGKGQNKDECGVMCAK